MPRKFPTYDSEPSRFEEATNQQVWRDAMVEYNSIMKNDVWDIVPRSKVKFVVTFRCLFKIKHVADGSIKKFYVKCVQKGSLRERDRIMRIPLL